MVFEYPQEFWAALARRGYTVGDEPPADRGTRRSLR
jgi:hypothetical protein